MQVPHSYSHQHSHQHSHQLSHQLSREGRSLLSRAISRVGRWSSAASPTVSTLTTAPAPAPVTIAATIAMTMLMVAAPTATAMAAESAPFADPPPTSQEATATQTEKAANTEPPPVRVWTTRQDAFVFTAEFKPGVPKPGQLTEILFSASSLPKTAHPRFGTQVPMNDAHLTLRFESPRGEDLGRYLAHALPLTKGRYGLHFTPSERGIYRLVLEGKTSEGSAVRAEFALPVNVWPLPDALQGAGDSAHAQVSRRVFTGTNAEKPRKAAQ